MSAASNYAENAIMALIFNGTAWANIADNAASSPLTSLYLALHTADPGEAGSQSTSETNYTSYARVAVARSSSGFTVSNNQASLTSTASFPAGTGGSGTITYFSVGVASSGSTNYIVRGTVTPNLTVGDGVTPQLTTATTISID